MKAKDVRKNGFSEYGPPIFYGIEPEPFSYTRKEISRTRLTDGGDVPFEEGKKYFISLGMDYGYYPGDATPEAYLVEYEEISRENPKYLKELDKFLKSKKAHEQLVKDWNTWKKLHDAEKKIIAKQKKEIRERKQYLELKKKYEK
jgi:hypothetical protein